MLRIYGSARSRAVRTLWMAGELGLTYEHIDLLPRSPGTKTPEYLALNPNGRVPTIDDDGFVLSEIDGDQSLSREAARQSIVSRQPT